MTEPEQKQDTRALVNDAPNESFKFLREIAEFGSRAMTFWMAANALQSWGAANRILDECFTALVYGASLAAQLRSGTITREQMQVFDTLKQRAELVIRLFMEDNYTKFGQLAGNPRLRREGKRMEREEEEE